MLLLCVVCMCLCVVGSNTHEHTEDTISDMFDEYWEWRMQLSPEWATFIGYEGYDDRLKSYDPDDFKMSFQKASDFLSRIRHYEQSDHHGEAEKVTLKRHLKLMKYQIETYIKGYHFRSFLNPVDQLEGIQRYFLDLLHKYEFVLKAPKDYENLIKRYSKLPKQINQIINVMKSAIREKKTNHMYSMFSVRKQLEQLQVPYNESAFYEPFVDIPNSVVPSQWTADHLRSQAKDVIERSVLPAFGNLNNFIENNYMKSLRENIAVTSLPGGHEYYRQCLKFHTSTDLTAEQIHEMGKREVHRIKKNMQEVVNSLGYDMSVKEFSNHLRGSTDRFPNSEKGLLDYVTNLIHRKIASQLHLVLKEEYTGTELRVEGAPPGYVGSAYYVGGNIEKNIPGKFTLNTGKYNVTPLYEMLTLALHEAEPGHHTQIMFLRSQKNLPMFLRNQEYFRISEVPFHFPFMTAYIEGWGLYSERLGFDMNLFEDPYDRYGHYSKEIFRACRLVVDTGMHALNWTREEALQYMIDNTASSVDKLKREVNRYITWPGQACAYKVGELKIIEMRELAENELGEKFHLRDFHDVILRCPGPLFVLKECVDEYIKTLKPDYVPLSSSVIVISNNAVIVTVILSLMTYFL